MRLLRCADSGILVELDGLESVLALHEALAQQPPEGVIDFVPAARTLLLRLDPLRADLADIERAVRAAKPVRANREVQESLTVPVVYGGPDLAEVARLIGLSKQEVVRVHTSTEWTVAFGGFAPGFGYLTGGGGRLAVPRRRDSRTVVPAGSVGLAGEFTGIYPRASPGGWQLIGHTELEIWRADRDPPALLRPGVRVRFAEVGS